MIALIHALDGTLSLPDGRPVRSMTAPPGGWPLPTSWRMAMRPYDWADIPEAEWTPLSAGTHYLIPADGPGFTRARVISEAETSITDIKEVAS